MSIPSEPSAGTATKQLDALVGERVMGDHRLDPPVIVGESHKRALHWKSGDEIMEKAPPYSSDIAAAWRVHLEMCNRPFSVRQRYLRAIQEQATTEGGWNLVAWPDVLVVLRDCFSEAICIAALAALENDHV